MTEQRTPEWFAARVGRVTGSKVGAILGLAPYMTRKEVMRSMVREYHGAESEFAGNIATQWGTMHEDEARQEYELETGHVVVDAPFVTYEDWAGASPDGYLPGDGLLEIKCPYGKRETGEFLSIDEQPHYYAQMQIQMLCTRSTWCDFYQWRRGYSKLERVEFDQEWIDINLPVLRQFYAEYLSEIDNPEHLEPLRKELNTLETKRLLDEYDELKEAAANAEDRCKEILTLLTEKAGGKNSLVHGRKLTQIERKGSVQYAKVVKAHCPKVDLEPYRGKSSTYWKLG